MKNVKYVKNTKFIVRKLKSESDTEDAETILSMMYRMNTQEKQTSKNEMLCLEGRNML